MGKPQHQARADRCVDEVNGREENGAVTLQGQHKPVISRKVKAH